MERSLNCSSVDMRFCYVELFVDDEGQQVDEHVVYRPNEGSGQRQSNYDAQKVPEQNWSGWPDHFAHLGDYALEVTGKRVKRLHLAS